MTNYRYLVSGFREVCLTEPLPWMVCICSTNGILLLLEHHRVRAGHDCKPDVLWRENYNSKQAPDKRSKLSRIGTSTNRHPTPLSPNCPFGIPTHL